MKCFNVDFLFLYGYSIEPKTFFSNLHLVKHFHLDFVYVYGYLFAP